MPYRIHDRVVEWETRGVRWPVFQDADGYYALRWTWDERQQHHVSYAVESIPVLPAGSVRVTWRERDGWSVGKGTDA